MSPMAMDSEPPPPLADTVIHGHKVAMPRNGAAKQVTGLVNHNRGEHIGSVVEELWPRIRLLKLSTADHPEIYGLMKMEEALSATDENNKPVPTYAVLVDIIIHIALAVTKRYYLHRSPDLAISITYKNVKSVIFSWVFSCNLKNVFVHACMSSSMQHVMSSSMCVCCMCRTLLAVLQTTPYMHASLSIISTYMTYTILCTLRDCQQHVFPQHHPPHADMSAQTGVDSPPPSTTSTTSSTHRQGRGMHLDGVPK